MNVTSLTNIWRSIVICLLVVVFPIVGAVAADPKTTPVIPYEGQGLWVTAICGHGCKEPMGPCDAYVLTEEEYQQQLKEKDYELKTKGKTPLLLTEIKPGIYYVAVEVPVDTSVVPMTGGVIPDPYRPDYLKFFMDDLPDHMVDAVSYRSGPDGNFYVIFLFRKWYKVIVEENGASPVVALFLDKNGSLEDWEKFYPKDELFQITLLGENQDIFWEDLAKEPQDINTTTEQRKNLIKLLKKGGRVCLPQADKPTVLWVDGKGLLRAKIVIADKLIFVR